MAVTEAPSRELAPEPERGRLLDWLKTTDHKKIGILYLISSFSFFAIGGVFALLMRTELARPGTQIFQPHVYNQLFTLHGTLMIFLVIFPLLAGFGNYFVPLQIGALDMAFPRINALSFWLLPVGGLTILSGFFAKGGAAAAGWTGYPPLSEQIGTGQDLWIAGLIIVGTASILGGINFIVTILRMRAPGMTMMRMPVFTWSILATSLLVVLAAPVLTAGLIMLFADRRLGTVFFDPTQAGVVILWQHVFWFFGHPEVYMLILGAWGIVTEIVSVFSGKPIFSYRGVILSFLLITALSFSVWAHHMFATGAVELPFFSVTTELISIPTGVLFFVWLGTLWKGRLRFEPPMLFALGFIAMFLIGGINGVWAASPAMDFAITDTYWVVAHLHYVLFGGTIFGVMAGMYYWFPKMAGRFLSRKLGVWQFWLQLVGFNLTFFPMHILGLRGMPRRIADYAPDRDDRVLREHLRHAPEAAIDDAGRPVGGQYPRVGNLLAASRPQLRRPAADPLRSPRLRPTHGRKGGGAMSAVAVPERTAQREMSGPVLGMVLFVASEAMFFGAFFAGYFTIRDNAKVWPPRGIPHLEIGIATILTVILVTSSLVIQLSLRSIRRGERRRAVLFLGMTIALGVVFLLLQLYDYSQLGFGVKDGTFGTLFYVMTGIHMAHVFGGVVFLALVLGQAMGGAVSPSNHDSLAAGAIYWDFVDVVWILLFTTFYLLTPR
jgi:cytochrome c oxidase subunit 1